MLTCQASRHEEAHYILRRLRGETGDDGGKAEAEFQDIKNIVQLETQTSQKNSYFHMLLSIDSGKLHTGRRVQLVIWLQTLQEWVGIAGVTICKYQDNFKIMVLAWLLLDAPTIFRIAGFNSQKSQ